MRMFDRKKRGLAKARKSAQRISQAIMEQVEARVMLTATGLTNATVGTGVEYTGPYSTYATVQVAQGSGSRDYSEFAFFEFDPSSFSPGYVVNTSSANNGVNSITLNLYNTATSGTHAPIAGTFDVYAIPDSTAVGTAGANLTYAPYGSAQNIKTGSATGLAALGTKYASPYDNTVLNVTSANEIGTFTVTSTLAAGYTSYTFTGLSSTVESIIANSFNTYAGGAGANVPMDIAIVADASTPTASVDWEGVYTSGTGQMNLDLNETPLTNVSEQYSIGAAASTNGVTVNAAAGVAEIDVVRTGNMSNTTTLNYSLSGTGYTGASTGTLNFNANQSTGEISVPLSTTQTADSSFTVTLTSDTPTNVPLGQTDNATVVAPLSATVKVVGSNLTSGASETTPVADTSTTDIETGGAYSSTYAPVNGSTSNGTGSFSYLSYEVVEAAPAPGQIPTAINSVSLQLDNTATSGNYNGHVGDFNLYYLPTATTGTNSPATSSLTFNSGVTDGVQGTTGAVLLGTFSFQDTLGYDTYTAVVTPAESNAMLQDLTSGSDSIRLAVTPGSANFAADFEGDYSASTRPQVSINATFEPGVTSSYSIGAAAAANGVTVAQNNVDNLVEVDVTRTGFTGDGTTLNYTATGGNTADYTSGAGSVTFAPGQTTAEIAIATNDTTPFTGTTAFNVTLTSVTITSPASGYNDTPSVVTPTAATVTMVGSSTPTGSTAIAPAAADNVTDIETGGPYSTTYASVNGSTSNGTGSFSYLAYEVVDMNNTTTPSLYPIAGTTINSVTGLTLSMYNTDNTAGTNYNGHTGDFNVYFLTGSETTDPTSGLTFDSGTTDGVNGAAGAVLLGTFSFSDNTPGYDGFSLTPAMLTMSDGNGSTIGADITGDLNSATPFRLAVAPGSANFAADWDGVYAGSTPTVGLDVTETVTATPEYFTFSSPTYSDPEDGTATITITRSGTDIADGATALVSTSDGNALAADGDYTPLTATTGLATFAPGSATATVNVSLGTLNTDEGAGDKFLNLTLSDPTVSGSQPTTPILGSATGQGTAATLTISDSVAQRQAFSSDPSNPNVNMQLDDDADVESTEVYSNTYVKATDLSSKYQSLGVLDYLNYTTPTNAISALDSASITVVNGSENGGGIAGPIDFYLVSDNTSTVVADTTTHTWNSADAPEGLGSGFGAATLIGTYDLTDVKAGDTVTIPLNYNATGEAALISAINSQAQFRIVITAESTTGAAVFADGTGNATAPILNVVAEEAPASSLPGWLTTSTPSDVVWNQGAEMLEIQSGGTATIIADPNETRFNSGAGDEPVITVDTGATLDVAPTDGSLMVHIGGLTVQNGAVAKVVQLVVPTTAQINSTGEYVASNDATNHETLVIGKLNQVNDPTFSIGTTGKLDLENNDMIIHTGSSDSGGYNELPAVQNLAYGTADGPAEELGASGTTGGRDNGAWDGNGLTSSVAEAQDNSDGTETVQLAVVDNNDLGNPFSAWTVGSAHETLGSGDIIVKYTYTGDFLLQGNVNGNDDLVFDGYYDGGASTHNEWCYGDCDDNGLLNGNDDLIFNGLYGDGTANSPFGTADSYVL